MGCIRKKARTVLWLLRLAELSERSTIRVGSQMVVVVGLNVVQSQVLCSTRDLGGVTTQLTTRSR